MTTTTIDWSALLQQGISDTDYHAQPTLSSTGARKLLACPARYKWERDNPPEHKRAFDLGHVVHTLVLGEGGEIVVVEADNWVTKAAKEARDAAYAVRATPVLRSEYDAAEAMRDAVMAHETAAEVFQDFAAELSGTYTDEQTGVALRFRPDCLTTLDGRALCVDLKTTVNADPKEFARSVAKFGYHAQAAWYLDGLIANGVEDPRFLFVAVEKAAPYCVSVLELDSEALAEGARLNRKAIDLFAQCVDTDTWPAYGPGIHTLSLPGWALRDANNEAAEQMINELKGLTA